MRKFFAIVTSLGLVAISKAQIIDEGTINGAGYTIIIPKDWNGTLMMYAHGYEETEAYSSEDGEEMWEQQDSEATEEQEDGEFHEIFTSRGYAVAASDYRSKGLVIKEGIEDTEATTLFLKRNMESPNSLTLQVIPWVE
jgi:hypothetical protein